MMGGTMTGPHRWLMPQSDVHTSRMRSALVPFVVIGLAVAACSSDDAPVRTSAVESAPVESEYAVLVSDSWRLQEAVEPSEGSPLTSIERPPLAWYAEYVSLSANASAMIRLSRHRASLADTVLVLEDVGFVLDQVSLNDWNAVGGSAPADPASPAILLLENGSTTLMMLSYEIDLDGLAPLANEVARVDQSTWIETEGVIE
jgi:hypothetical protein